MTPGLLVRGVFRSEALRFAFADTSNLCSQGIVIHDCDPASGEVLCDLLTASALTAVLLDEGEIMVPGDYILGEVNGTYSRAAICQWDKLHYLVVNTSQEQSYIKRHKVRAFAEFIQELGCETAYALDGGQTTAIVMDDELVTLPDYKTQRRISDIIYFATALPDGG